MEKLSNKGLMFTYLTNSDDKRKSLGDMSILSSYSKILFDC